MTETREQVVARVTAAVEGAADGAFDFDRPNPVTGAPLGLVAPPAAPPTC
ncbi:N-acetylglucosamine-6-phosphate deacetylase [Bifidobacterium breve 2L]|nr:N-acetylglucosamine-6-phosphate deacetylase [Bifidobacterium breve 2L]